MTESLCIHIAGVIEMNAGHFDLGRSSSLEMFKKLILCGFFSAKADRYGSYSELVPPFTASESKYFYLLYLEIAIAN